LQGPDANPFLSWALLQRGLWVHGVDTLHEYFVSTLDYELSPVADRISCPTLLTLAEEDPIAAFAPKLYEALEVPEKRLVRRPRGGPSTTSACSTGSTRCYRRHRGSTVRERTSSEVRQYLPDLPRLRVTPYPRSGILIHRSAWKGSSANFASTAFSEVVR
jgi:hypothetical protein